MITPDIILIDDEKDIRHSYVQSLELAGYSVRAFARAEAALALLSPGFPGIVISDIRMPGMDGMTFLSKVNAIDCELPVVLVTGHGDTPLAVRAMREGAQDFLEKPCPARLLVEAAGRALERRRRILDQSRLRILAGQRGEIDARLLGHTPAIADIRRRIAALASADTEVMIVGETGTGKQLAARLLHEAGKRSARPFVVVNCASLSPQLAEVELFGHEAGIGAASARARFGKFEQAHGGTLLLDDLPSLAPELQARLVGVVENREIVRVGSLVPIPVDIRLVATASEDPNEGTAAGGVRADLLYRLKVVTLRMPSLAERREDIPLLFRRFVEEARTRYGLPEADLPPAILEALARRDWPGHVRELRNAAERFVLGVGQSDEFPARQEPALSLAEKVAFYERSVIASALTSANGRLKTAYEELGISRKTLYEKMQKHALDKRDFGVDDLD